MTIPFPARRAAGTGRRARRLAVAAALACLPLPARAQVDSVTVVAGPRYRVGPALELLLGGGYRELWTLPVRVEVLDTARFAGGLRPSRDEHPAAGGPLLFQGADGLHYTFAPLTRPLPLAEEPALRGTLAGRVVEDRTSARHPAATIVAAALLRAAGVWHHALPRLVALPPGGEIGVLQEEFSGAAPPTGGDPVAGDGEARPAPGSDAVLDTDELVRRLRADPDERVDPRAYLAARVMDLYLGSPGGSGNRWRWSRTAGDDGRWTPIPLGREFAFADQDGLLFRARNRFLPPIARFDGRPGRGLALTTGDLALDHQILAGVSRSDWHAVADSLRRRLSDAAIADALRSMPPEYHARSAVGFGAILRARRDGLPETVDGLYRLLSSDVEVHGTERADLARVQRFEDGTVAVRLHAATPGGDPAAAPYFERVLLPGETREVRIHLHGGADRALLVGPASRGPRVRFVGGAGEDVLVDSSEAGWGASSVAFHDQGTANHLLARPRTFIDLRPPTAASDGTGPSSPGREWGAERSVRPTLSYHSSVGVVMGGRAKYTRYGFRQRPFAYEIELRSAYASRARGFSADLRGEFHRISSDVTLSVDAHASQFELVRYYGFGNETRESDADAAGHDVLQDGVVARAALRFPLLSSGSVSIGPVLKYTAPRIEPGSLIDRDRPLGSEPFGQLGAMLGMAVDRRDDPAAATRGFVVESTGAYYPATWDVSDAFGRAGGRATGYAPAPLPGGAVLGISVSGERLWGRYPLQEAAFLGGGGNLGGYRGYRFAGDAALAGRVGVRTRLTTANLLVRGDLGAFAVANAGRVFYQAEPSDRWHADAGGGLWFLTRVEGKEPYAVSLTLMRGERVRVFLGTSMPF